MSVEPVEIEINTQLACQEADIVADSWMRKLVYLKYQWNVFGRLQVGSYRHQLTFFYSKILSKINFSIQSKFSSVVSISSTKGLLVPVNVSKIQYGASALSADFILGRPCGLTILVQITNRFRQLALHSESISILDMLLMPNTSYAVWRGEISKGTRRLNQEEEIVK